MSKTIASFQREAIAQYNTKSNTYEDFSIGAEVKIITPFCDFYFFYGETGKVIENTKDYLGIIVKFDIPRKFKGGYIQTDFNFNPQDLFLRKVNRFELMDI